MQTCDERQLILRDTETNPDQSWILLASLWKPSSPAYVQVFLYTQKGKQVTSEEQGDKLNLLWIAPI